MKDPKVPSMLTERIEATDEFIEKNKLQLKTQEQIAEKLKECFKDPVMFDFRPEVLLQHLDWSSAKEHYTEDYVKDVDSGEKKWECVTDVKEVAQDFLDYMNFAWGKALDQRGLSASRSVSKLGVWLWLLSREDLEEMISSDDLYNPYGAPALIAVCNELGIKVPEYMIEFAKEKC